MLKHGNRQTGSTCLVNHVKSFPSLAEVGQFEQRTTPGVNYVTVQQIFPLSLLATALQSDSHHRVRADESLLFFAKSASACSLACNSFETKVAANDPAG